MDETKKELDAQRARLNKAAVEIYEFQEAIEQRKTIIAEAKNIIAALEFALNNQGQDNQNKTDNLDTDSEEEGPDSGDTE